MLAAIGVLLRARLQIGRNSFWRGSLGARLASLALVALVAVGSLAIFSFTGFVVETLGSPRFAALLREAATQNPGLPADPAPFLAAVPGTVLLGALTLLVFSSFSSLLSALYLSGDLDMLLVAPVPMRAVFVVKFFTGLLPQYLVLFALLGPVLLGYGQGRGYGPLYHLCATVALLLMPLLPAGLGALLVMAVVRVLPARRAREIVSLLGGLIGIAFYLLSQFAGQVAPQFVTTDNLGVLLATDLPLLPSAWAGRALVAAGEGRILPLLAYGGLFAGTSIGVFGACLLLAERLYYAGWSNMAAQGGRVRSKRSRHDAPSSGQPPLPLRMLPPESRAILVKDLRLFARDLRNLQALIFPLAIAAIWTFQILRESAAPAPPDTAPAWFARLNDAAGLGIAFFICLSLSSALAGTGISREGRAFWLLKLAPVSPWHLLLGKLTLAYLPFPLVGTLFLALLALIRGTGPLALLEQWLLLLLCGLGCAAIGMGLGAAFPRLDWENPQQQTTWQSGCLGTLLYPLFLATMLALVLGGGALSAVVGGVAGLGLRLAGWAVALALTVAVAWGFSLLGTRGLERIEL